MRVRVCVRMRVRMRVRASALLPHPLQLHIFFHNFSNFPFSYHRQVGRGARAVRLKAFGSFLPLLPARQLLTLLPHPLQPRMTRVSFICGPSGWYLALLVQKYLHY